MKNAIIFHGAANNSQGNWFPWVKEELEKKGYKVWSPDLPNSDYPVLADWLKTVFDNNWDFNEETVMVGHSAGATFILRVLENLSEGVAVNKAILVAGVVEMGTNPEFFQYKEGMVKPPFNWEKIKKSCSKFFFVASDNDPYQCGIDQSEIFQKHLGGEIILKKGEGHFNLEKSPEYKQFPLVLELIEKQ